ncbi:MAG TPA: efflux RND transporter periplasmic adaptor subunit, partial [Burkholderiaceae bacterium]|nr:efflux RND transporter periplasmic adaptor subunit [Burkholderiaceae bacterium]
SKPVPPEERKPVTAVQPAAVTERHGRKVVFVVKDGRLQQTPVAVGRKIGELLEVRGVQAGDQVVLNPSADLEHGSAVASAKK